MLKDYFSTSLQTLRVADEDLRQRLEKACWILEEEDLAGQRWCEENAYGGYTSYASLDDLPKRFPSFADLSTVLQSGAEQFAEHHFWDLEPHHLKLDSLWVNILGPGATHSGHIHPQSAISGTYYVKVPDKSGRLKLEDPRLGRMMAAPAVKASAPDSRKRFVYIDPSPGQALFWESWLRHEVTAGDCEDARISISYNFSF